MAGDAASLYHLRKLGWKPVVIWECETQDAGALARRIARRVGNPRQA
jgi:G:T-mismatch repair DNA endonuclease (very short patch repair protein)